MKTAVLVPVYNAEKFLPRCLESLSAQTSGAYAAIFVDDGSTDASRTLLDRFAEGRPGTIVDTIPNGGVSAARNRGLELALADPEVDSVLFLDSDDRLFPECIGSARRFLAEAPSAIHAWRFTDDGGGAYSTDTAVWCRLYPRSALADVRFFTGSDVAEDIAFNLEVAHRHHASVIGHEAVLYHYTSNAGSTMHRELTARDFEMRSALIEYLVRVYGDDDAALDRLCRSEIPDLLKQFWRHLRRVRKPERPAAAEIFRSELESLDDRGLLKPRAGGFKELKYFLRFKWMAR